MGNLTLVVLHRGRGPTKYIREKKALKGRGAPILLLKKEKKPRGKKKDAGAAIAQGLKKAKHGSGAPFFGRKEKGSCSEKRHS